MARAWRRWVVGIVAVVVMAAVMFRVAGAKDKEEHKAAVGPKVVYILRHGEKPEGETDVHLTAKGVERAKALVHVIPEHFSTPDFIFATAPSKNSSRPLETVEPLAESLKLKVLDVYKNAEFAKLATEVLTGEKYAGKTVLICWHHGEIPALAKALGATNAPEKWAPEVFDRVWKLTYAEGKVTFEDLPQKALKGDAEK